MTLERDTGRKSRPVWLQLPATAALALAALGGGPAAAVDLSECFKMPPEQKAYLNGLEQDCRARNVYCEVVLMTIPEVDVKMAELAAWNEANEPERERKLRSGLGACDGMQQAYLVEEIIHLANPGPSGTPAQPGWQAGKGQPVYVDPKGQRWRFEPALQTGGRTYTLDQSRPPLRQAQGVLVQMQGYYKTPGAPDLIYPGTMESTATPAPAPAPDPPVQSSNPRPSRDVLCQRNPQLYSCLGG
ncbi:MAG: hypothetical protein R3D25_22990 [Geminicoccaceae bacterium]